MEGARAWGRGVGVCQQPGTAAGAVWGAEPGGQRELGTPELLQVCTGYPVPGMLCGILCHPREFPVPALSCPSPLIPP